MSMLVFRGSVEQGFIYALVALGLYLSYRTLDIADLTVDGSFTLGAAVSAVCTMAGHPIVGLLLAALAGGMAGIVTATLQTRLGVAPILAGIITMTALYSINLKVAGERPNLSLLRVQTVFSTASTLFGIYAKLLVAGGVVLAVSVVLLLFLRTRLGLSVRATGNNRVMVRASSINPAMTVTVGLSIANAMVAVGGALLAQYQLSFDITMGTGMVVIGLASLIIGEVVTRCDKFGGIGRAIAAATIGAVLYRLIMALALSVNASPSNLKLMSALIVAAAISYPAIGKELAVYRLKKEARHHAGTKSNL